MPNSTEIRPGTASILLVEDNPADARLFAEMMRDNRRFEISWAKSFGDALDQLASHRFDVIVLDLNLPDGDGVSLVERLLGEGPVPPIVVLSGCGQTDLDVARAAVSAGAQDFLQKDRIEEVELNRSLSMAIERHRLHIMLAQRERELEEAQRLAKVGDWHWQAGSGDVELSAETHRQLGTHQALFKPGIRAVIRRITQPSRVKLRHHIRRALIDHHEADLLIEVEQQPGAKIAVRLEIRTRVDDDGTLTGLFGIAQDVSEIQAAERMKREFISVVSHELRTPLTSILGSLKLVLSNVMGDLLPKQHGLLTIAKDNGERLLALINDLLDVEKIESGQMEFKHEPHDINGLVRETVQQNQPYADQFEVTLRLVELDHERTVDVDIKRFGQLLSNLISNAAKFSEPGGEVLVEIVADDQTVTLAVIDHGQGIPWEFQAHVFDKFAQADSSDQRRHQGTGLGLGIVKLIAEGHGGTCRFESVPGEGTVFIVDLPAPLHNRAERTAHVMLDDPSSLLKADA